MRRFQQGVRLRRTFKYAAMSTTQLERMQRRSNARLFAKRCTRYGEWGRSFLRYSREGGGNGK
jgi:hypothetical protein